MSTSSSWSAARTTASGTVSRCLTPGDRLDHVVQRLEVLDVHGGDDVDAGVEELVDVLPPLGVAGAGDVRVRELVDERDLRVPGEDGVEVHLLEACAAVLDRPGGARPRARRSCRRCAAGRGSRRSRRRRRCRARGGDAPRRASRRSCPRLARHRGRCAADHGSRLHCGPCRRTGRCSQGIRRGRLRAHPRSSSARLSCEDVHAGLADEAEQAALRLLVDERRHRGGVEATRRGDSRRPAAARTPG